MPIGTELSNWGSKTVDKLDFGFGEQLFGLNHEYREGWLMQKLHAPRSFDQQKVKNPTEKLRMPWFRFAEDEVQALATFVVGLVDDEVQRADMVPTPDKLAMDTGKRAVRQKNCMACHQLEPGRATYEDEDGQVHTIAADLLPFEDSPTPPLFDLAIVRDDAEYFEVDEIGLRVLGPEPDIGMDVGDRVFVPVDKLIGLEPARGGDFVPVVTDYYYNGIELFDEEAEDEDEAYSNVTADPDGEYRVEDVDGQFRDHSGEPYDKIRWTFAPPVLWDEGDKINRDWFYRFLGDIVPLRHQIRTRMPSFHYDEGEKAAIADYFAHDAKQRWFQTYARRLRLHLAMTLDEMSESSGLDARILADIEQGNELAIKANFAKVFAFGTERGFAYHDPLDPAYEASRMRSTAYLEERGAEMPGHLQIGESIVTGAVNCYQCHFRLGQAPAADPIAWAPDLALSAERLREDWVLRWLTDPGRVYPGTAMPANFQGDPPQYQDLYPNSNNAEQLLVVLEWLYNFDRVELSKGAQ